MEQKWLLSMLLKNLKVNIRREVIGKNPASLAEFEECAANEEKVWLTIRCSQSSLNPQAIEFGAAVNTSRSQGQDV